MDTLNQWTKALDWYESIMGESGDNLHKGLINPTMFQLLGNLSDKRILDAGCGSGYFSAKIAPLTKEVVGTDFSQQFIDLCNKKYKQISNISFFQHDITSTMPFKNDHFDIVLSRMVLQYVSDITIFAQESFRVLVSGGRLIVVVDHPFHTQTFYLQQQLGKGNPDYPNLSPYGVTQPHTKYKNFKNKKISLTWYSRKVADYLNPFIKLDFRLERIEENTEEKNGLIYPRILFLVFEK